MKMSKSVEFVSDLNYGNYLEKKETIIDSVNLIMEISDLTIIDIHNFTGIHPHTLRNVLRRKKVGILRTYSKLNSFVFGVLDEDNYIDDISVVLDENVTGDVN